MAAPGKVIGRYRLAGRIGAGGMGEVFLAHDVRTGRPVAIKRLPTTAGQSDDVARLREEARIQARLFHPNLATLLELVETEAGPCLVMEYIGGPTLRDWAANAGAPAWREKVALVAALARGVAYLHARGVVHRDIKPDNVRIADDGAPKLLDFGIARGPDGPRLTRQGQVVGTIQYMAPEQLAGAPATPRTDVWALGLLLYELLAGRSPFVAVAESELISQIRAARFTEVGSLVGGLPPGVGRLVRRCLAAKPERRPADAGAVAAALDELLAGAEAPAAVDAAAGSWRGWRPLPTLASLAALLVPAAGFLVLRNGVGPEPLSGTAADDAPAADRQLMTVEGLGHRYDVYRDGERLGQTPLRFQAAFGSEVQLECRRDGNTVYHLAFTVGLRKSYPCRN